MPNRLAAVREQLQAAGLDALLVTHPANRRYLTGFVAEDDPPNESAGHVVITRERAVLIVSPLEAERARLQAPDFEVVDRVRPLAKADAAVLSEVQARRVGFEADAILYRDVKILEEELNGAVELVPVDSLVLDLRAVKTADEIDRIARAAAITDQAFERVAGSISTGDTERTIALRLDTAMRELGAEGPAFPTIVAAGPNAALPHHEPGDRPVEPGEPVVIDMGARVDGYCADLTRTVWIGSPNETLREIYPVVHQALETASARLRAGLTGREADALARDVIAAAGYGDFLPHSVGHGVGVQVHEKPSLSPRSDEVLAVGNVVTIEPGIYLPGRGGVRIEDLAVVEADGIRGLSRARIAPIDGAPDLED